MPPFRLAPVSNKHHCCLYWGTVTHLVSNVLLPLTHDPSRPAAVNKSVFSLLSHFLFLTPSFFFFSSSVLPPSPPALQRSLQPVPLACGKGEINSQFHFAGCVWQVLDRSGLDPCKEQKCESELLWPLPLLSPSPSLSFSLLSLACILTCAPPPSYQEHKRMLFPRKLTSQTAGALRRQLPITAWHATGIPD